MLQKCILKVYEGQIWANSEQLSFLLESVADAPVPPITDANGVKLLTNRELSLVQLVAEGLTNRDISKELRLSEHTVRNCLFRIFNKLGVSTRLELALYAIHQRNSRIPERRERRNDAARKKSPPGLVETSKGPVIVTSIKWSSDVFLHY